MTGNPRRVRDSAAEIYNLIQEWNKNLVSGANVLSSLSGMKLAKMYVYVEMVIIYYILDNKQ